MIQDIPQSGQSASSFPTLSIRKLSTAIDFRNYFGYLKLPPNSELYKRVKWLGIAKMLYIIYLGESAESGSPEY